eukprot:TRINITY_DN2481_c0_g1_i1.p2 TRINITY_DN2481_c0_g1~~TRINITY_DN2481_c0_g1_i1.p2  ORF type:complete len:289 (+),score=39.70 TRINITY_DN2481_c0_g1_i1:116-868(+)
MRRRNKSDLLRYRIEYGEAHNATLFYSTNDRNGIFSNFANLPFQFTNKFEQLEKYPSLIKAAQKGLSYFAPYDCFFNLEWKTTEHLFQAAKFGGEQISEDAKQRIVQIRESDKPGQAARLGRMRDVPIRADWEEIKKDVMFVALLAKTDAHKAMLDALLDTGDTLVVEDTTTSNDMNWGCGYNGLGANLLGKLLMAVRAGLDISDDQTHASQQVEYWMQEARKDQREEARPAYLPSPDEEKEFLSGGIGG